MSRSTDEKCPSDCGHSKEEHEAFDLGVKIGRTEGIGAINPYEPGDTYNRIAFAFGLAAGVHDNPNNPPRHE